MKKIIATIVVLFVAGADIFVFTIGPGKQSSSASSPTKLASIDQLETLPLASQPVIPVRPVTPVVAPSTPAPMDTVISMPAPVLTPDPIVTTPSMVMPRSSTRTRSS